MSKSITFYGVQIEGTQSFTNLKVIGTNGYFANKVPSMSNIKWLEQNSYCTIIVYEDDQNDQIVYNKVNIIRVSNIDWTWEKELLLGIQTHTILFSRTKNMKKETLWANKTILICNLREAKKIN